MVVPVIHYIIIIFASFAGLLLAVYIHHKKQLQEKMVCPLNFQCEPVIYSKYSKFLGIPVELLGILYYGLTAVSYAIFLIFPVLIADLSFAWLSITFAAFLFSLYLTFIQGFLLRQWCSWCLMSAGLCMIIFFSSLIASQSGFAALVAENIGVFYALHLLGIVLGVGGATITDILFFNFLKDLRISEMEAEIMRTISEVVWIGLALLVFSALGLYFADPSRFSANVPFLVSAVATVALVICGAFYNLLLAPRLVQISFKEEHAHEPGELKKLRCVGFALGAITLISWYTVFFLNVLVDPDRFTFWPLLSAYAVVTAAAVIISQMVEERLGKKS